MLFKFIFDFIHLKFLEIVSADIFSNMAQLILLFDILNIFKNILEIILKKTSKSI